MAKVSLDRSTLEAADLPPYPGIAQSDITLVTTAETAVSAHERLMSVDAIGFDTESKPTFLRGSLLRPTPGATRH